MKKNRKKIKMIRAASTLLGTGGTATSAGVVAAYLNRIEATAANNAYITVEDEHVVGAAA